ncbi:hypothetical protein LWX53_00935 [bacterium]|nr:hypothetical protein [bacterium]
MGILVSRIALSFVIAGVWIAAATLVGERLGSRKAGLIGNLPSNILISLLFMALTKGSDYAAAATAGVPMGMAIDSIFLAVLIFALGRGLAAALGLALASWAVVATLAVAVLPPLGYAASLAVFAAAALSLFLLADARLGREKVEKKPVPFSWKVMALRAFFAGTIVAGAVAIAQVAPPYMTGVLATFPAVLTTTMVILARSQGVAFARATGKILILSNVNIVVYTTCVGLLYPTVGPWLGTLLAFAASVVSIYLVGRLTQRLV